MHRGYEEWLRRQRYDPGTVSAQLYRASRVEKYYGDLDDAYQLDQLRTIIDGLRYSVEDERSQRPNTTSIPIVGNIKANLSTYRDAISRYRRFCDNISGFPALPEGDGEGVTPARQLSVQPRTRHPVSLRAEDRITLQDHGFDGFACLEAIIAGSRFKTIEQAVASLTVFTHPETAKQTENRALFKTIRNIRQVGQYADVGDQRVMFDDNKSPTDAFLWSNQISRRGRDIQFNHLYALSSDFVAYSALPNICMTPAFIAKLTDTTPYIRELLQYRSFELYGWKPAGLPDPGCPALYRELDWAPTLQPVPNLEGVLRSTMSTKPKDRTVKAASEIGWLFGKAQGG